MNRLIVGEQITCRCASVYSSSLTYGRKYTLLGSDPAKKQIKTLGDNGRTRWYPMFCFEPGEIDLPFMMKFRLTDEIESSSNGSVVVEVDFSHGERRWCLFATPAALAASGDLIDGTQVRMHYSMPHLIIVTELTEAVVTRALHIIEQQGALVSATLPIVSPQRG